MFVLDHATCDYRRTANRVGLGRACALAEAVAKMGLKHCVITSVTRDELADGGTQSGPLPCEPYATATRGTAIEVLTPDLEEIWIR